jgi:organic radical activating enzyme
LQQINLQPPVKRVDGDGPLLIHSIFRTIQGEGPNVGMPSTFIRLGGCNLQCPGCDTDYTDGNEVMSVKQILDDVILLQNGTPFKSLIVITGGEPFRQNLMPLIKKLTKSGYKVQIETNGTLGFDLYGANMEGLQFQIVVSPKAGRVHSSLWSRIVAYKYVVNAGHIDPNDGLPTEVLGLPGRPARPFKGYAYDVYIQPADEMSEPVNKLNLVAAIQSCMKHGHRLCLQTHKLIGLP